MHESLEEIEDERGYRYYYRRRTMTKFKENPKLIVMLKNIKLKSAAIRYSSYKGVIKLNALKNALLTHCIPIRSVLSIIQKHKAGSNDGTIRPHQLSEIVHDMFFAAEKAGFYVENKTFNLTDAVSILCNFLWNVFDPKRSTPMMAMELKLTMLLLCELPTVNTFHTIIDYHFDIAKDHNNCITRNRFEEIINVAGKIFSYLGDPLYLSDSKVVTDILNEAFQDCPGLSGMNQYTFSNLWTTHQSSKFSTYTNIFLIMIRFKKSEFVIHQNQCAGCGIFPITGLRYKCQKCQRFSLCFDCFSKGFTSKRHHQSHRMYELSTNEKDIGVFRTLMMKFCSIFHRRKSSDDSLSIGEIDHDPNKLIEDAHIELVQIDADMEGGTLLRATGQRRGTMREIFNNSENLMIVHRNLVETLSAVIENVKTQTENLEHSLENNEKVDDIINDHRSFMKEHIDQLKNMHDALIGTLACCQDYKSIRSELVSPTMTVLPHSSTPYRHNTKHILKDINVSSSALCKTINGAELNKSYVEAENVSISDISAWYQTKLHNNVIRTKDVIKTFDDEVLDTKIDNFRQLLMKVKEIIDDSYSDNAELAKTTSQFESILDLIIDAEEKKRSRN